MRFNLLPGLLTSLLVSISTESSAQGLVLLSTEEQSQFDEAEFEGLGYATNFPAQHDMLKYAPPPLQQSGSSCAGFAASYCAHSTMMNKVLNRTHPVHKWIVSFDPYFHYSLINGTMANACDIGAQFPRVFEMMQQLGSMRDLYPPSLSCKFNWISPTTGELKRELEPIFHAALPYRINDFGYLDLSRSDWMTIMKTFVANDIPVIIGAQVTDNFSPTAYGGQIDNRGIWNYRASASKPIGGHAMCVLGYNDMIAGGAFLVRNSWGYDFGDNGDVWIKYSDFKQVVREAWVIKPETWTEKTWSPDDYTLTLKSTMHDDLDYVILKAENTVYEGFATSIPNKKVWAFELYDDGAVYFGEWVDFKKHGSGTYWSAEGNRFVVQSRYGEVISFEAGYAAAEDQTFPMIPGVEPDWAEEDLPEFEGTLPSVNYKN